MHKEWGPGLGKWAGEMPSFKLTQGRGRRAEGWIFVFLMEMVENQTLPYSEARVAA